MITRTTIINRLFGDDDTREVFDREGGIMVTAFSVERADAVLRNGRLSAAGAYVLLGCGKAHVGESRRLAKRIRRQLQEPSKSFAKVCYVVTELGQGFSKQDGVHIQACLDAAIEDAGIVEPVKGQEPWPADLPPERIAELDRKFPHILRLLKDAGCIAVLERPLWAAAGAPLHDLDDGDMEIRPAGDIPNGEREWTLEYADYRARGYDDGDGRFVVLSGSEIRLEENKSIIAKIRTRRHRLLAGDCTARIPGVTDRERLKVCVVFPSRTIAAKVLAAAHLQTDNWRSA